MPKLLGITIGPIPIRLEWDEPLTPPGVLLDFRLGDLTITLTRGKRLDMKLTLPDDSQIGFVLPAAGKDARGNAVPLKTPPTVTVSDPAILTLVMPNPATPENPLSGVVQATGPIGTAQLVLRDEDESTQPLLAVVDFEVVAGELVALGDPTFGPIEKIPPTA